jgi:Na+/glutamate symporter
MRRCTQCNGSLIKSETSCFTCGAPVENKADTKTILRQRFFKIVNVAFYICLALTVASIVTSYVPSFVKCLGATVILHLVKSSAEQMSQNSRSS